jgi:E3 ubiquitin-protein ligase SHPRH
MTDTSVIFDPERLTNFFFEKRIIEANSVDVDDPRYHAIELDAGDEEEESKGEAEGGSSAITSEAVLLKNRFRGTSKRSVQKVWYYHPRRKLQALCRDVPGVEDRIARLEGEAAYLENRIREELGEERARLALKEGFDALQASHGDKDGEKANICPLCYDQIEVPGILPCLHTACFACLLDCIAKMGQGGKTPCPMCRKPFERTDVIEVLPSLDESDHMNEFGVKISGVISHIRRQLQVDPNLKIVIFSAWSTHLRYLTEALNNLTEPILSVAFSGKSQSRALREFQNNNQVRIILVPMKMAEGAAGLTLNVASVAYLLEPSLDSALENQALGRLNRIGQKADKTTYFRVLAQNTIGEKTTSAKVFIWHLADALSCITFRTGFSSDC